MATLNDFNKVNGVTRAIAEHVNDLIASTLRSEYNNSELVSATRYLLDVDTPIQRINCNGANRVVALPEANMEDNHIFFVINSSAGPYSITMMDSDETVTFATIAKDNAALFLPDANGSWKVIFVNAGTALNSVINNYLTGLILSNNVSDATNDIDIATGQAADSTNEVYITNTTAFTKKLDANWVAGTNQGMRNSGAAITNTTYHIYLVSKANGASPDYYAHTSATISTVLTALQAETGGSSYIYARRIGSIVRTGGAIKGFVQDGDRFSWLVPVQDVSAGNPGTYAVTRTLTVPTGIRVEANLTVDGYGGNSAGMPRGIFISDLSIADTSVSDACFTVYINTTSAIDLALGVTTKVMTNTSAQVRSRLQQSTVNTNLIIVTHGWVDTRGR